MFKKFFAIAVALSALGMVLAGCQGGGEASGDAAKPAETKEAGEGDGK